MFVVRRTTRRGVKHQTSTRHAKRTYYTLRKRIETNTVTYQRQPRISHLFPRTTLNAPFSYGWRFLATGANDLPKEMSKQTLKELINDKQSEYVLIDVRNPHELEHGVIETSHNIPLANIEKAFSVDDSDTWIDNYKIEKPAKETQLIFYCRSGARSDKAARFALQNGYKDVSNYSGSYIDWFGKSY